MAERRPVLIFDGDCGICTRWVDYWRALTGERVVYRPYQEAAADYPRIPRADFERAIQFIDRDGTVHAGAAATFKVLSYVRGRGGWWWLYQHLPGFAPIAELAYGFFARRRGLLNVVTRTLWGTVLEPVRYDLVRWIFLRGIGLVYFTAFASLAVQILGLVGSEGILPIEVFLQAAQRSLGDASKVLLPTLFWFNASDGSLVAGTLVGMLLATFVVADFAVTPALIGLFVLYLSYSIAGQAFTSYQWDGLLLEAGFLAIFLPAGSRVVVWVYRLFIFRYLFMAGWAKLASGDATWRDLSALSFHFETQPLPSPLAWYAAHLPPWLLSAATASALIVEVGVALLIFAPRRLRALAAWAVIVFQVLILLTGNYNFFNLLTILLCVFLFDDAALRRALPAQMAGYIAASAPRPGHRAVVLAALMALIVAPVGINRLWHLQSRDDLPLTAVLTDMLNPLMIVNGYGLFASMTTERPEIVIEGSNDGETWRAYEFRYKPGDLKRAPSWSIPHQPRLDWQMWFAALGDPRQEWWFSHFLARIMTNSPEVMALLANNPFPDRPPRWIRAQLYDYRFTAAETRTLTGAWWKRELVGDYVPAVTLEEMFTPRE